MANDISDNFNVEVPEGFRRTASHLASLSNDQFDRVLDGLMKVENPNASLSAASTELASLTEGVFDNRQARNLIEFAISSKRASEALGIEPLFLAKAVAGVLHEEEELDDLDTVEQRLVSVIDSSFTYLRDKAETLSNLPEPRLTGVRCVVDMRAVFSQDDLVDSPFGYMVVPSLHFEYRESGKSQTLSVLVSEDDLVTLRGVVDRAIEKYRKLGSEIADLSARDITRRD